METNLKVIILVGIPGSGKTTWTKKFLAGNPDYVSVNRDAYRFMLRNEGLTESKIEGLITNLQNITMYKALRLGLNVIIDATHVKKGYIKEICKSVKHKADVEFKVLNVPLETCIERDNNRERKAGEEVITRMYEDFKNLKNIFDFKPIYKTKPTIWERIVYKFTKIKGSLK